LLFFAMARVEDGLRGLARNATNQIEGIQVELRWLVAAEHNQFEHLAFQSDWRDQE
jgi:hypothetical protein